MSVGIRYRQRDIVLIPFPYSDLTGAKQRPALILSNEALGSRGDHICCLITSAGPADALPIGKGDVESALPLKSWVKPHRLFTIDEMIVRKRLTRATPAFHRKVVEKVERLLATV